MIRFILLSILLTILLRAVSRMWGGIVRGMQGQDRFASGSRGGSRVPQAGVQMVRDPMCGTFVVPGRAVASSSSGGAPLYFCSIECRDKYRTSQEADRARARGRTA
jgi:YHS domain-containing protein